MNGRLLQVLVVSEDRRMLRHLSQFLQVFGYDPRSAADLQQGRAALAGDRPDYLIIDADLADGSGMQLCRAVDDRAVHDGMHRMLLVGQTSPSDLTDALEAGIDDFLAKPINHGELLVRLRAGARALEFERRRREQAILEPRTGLPSRNEWKARLGRELNRAAGSARPPACALIDIDGLGRLNRLHGRPFGDQIIREVADRLRGCCTDDQLLGAFGGGRFAVLLSEMSDVEAADAAEPFRAAVAEMDLAVEDEVPRLTASLGVAGCRAGQPCSADELIEDAQSALRMAKYSGRNCVVRFAQFDEEARRWAELAAPGKLFEKTLARDVMTPCTLVLRPDDSLAQAAALLRSAQLRALPVVDPDGQLTAIVSRSALPADDHQHVRDIMATDPPSIEEATPFAELMDFCSSAVTALIAIVHNGRPTGFVAPSQLAALTEPLTTASFAPTEAYSATSRYLLVPDASTLDDA